MIQLILQKASIKITTETKTIETKTKKSNPETEDVRKEDLGMLEPEKHIPIETDKVHGYMDPSGNIRINNPDIRFPKPFSEGLAQGFHIGKKHGYIDQTGEFVIDPIYRRTYPFSERLAKVCVEEQQ